MDKVLTFKKLKRVTMYYRFETGMSKFRLCLSFKLCDISTFFSSTMLIYDTRVQSFEQD